ncbi:3'-5' exonuclease [Ramlibacter sp. G-1-2-2]|uniref:3'-5' exonuclease n=1 Tax=Ramlibacter agri TaxID=2728837 RepID=A0A848H1L7_9BURK|nr:3'-5' exonuclease [Ramlibacter agri]NML43471.1 3'-5' exonuclease [Ramlibacter agri]
MHRLHWTECDFVVVDVEGNGCSPQDIVEVAAVHIDKGREQATRVWMARPCRPITTQATRVHGITNEHVARERPFADFAEEIRADLGSAIIVGHHVGIDLSLLAREIPNWQPGTSIDTLRLAKHLFPTFGGHSLEALTRRLGLKDTSVCHRAREDAQATARLFIEFASRLAGQMHLDLLTLARLGASRDDPLLRDQQGTLF